MEFIVVERSYDPPITQAEIEARMRSPNGCYDLWRVKHVLTVLSLDGRKALCMYEAPDAASVRNASEQNGDAYDRIWTGERFVKCDP